MIFFCTNDRGNVYTGRVISDRTLIDDFQEVNESNTGLLEFTETSAPETVVSFIAEAWGLSLRELSAAPQKALSLWRFIEKVTCLSMPCHIHHRTGLYLKK